MGSISPDHSTVLDHRTRGVGLLVLVAANLVVALLAVRHRWGYYETLLIYWAEVAVLGGYNVLRLLVVGVFGAAPFGAWAERYVDLGSRLNRLGLTLVGVGLFVVKFGTFALVIGLFVVLLPAMLQEGESGGVAVHRALMAAGPGAATAVAALVLSHGISFVRNFLLGREYDRVGVVELVVLPYARMGLVLFVLLAGVGVAGFWPGVRRETGFALVMVLLKLLADAASHLVEHRWLAGRPVRA